MYIVANFKQNKTLQEYEAWLNEFIQNVDWDKTNQDLQIVLAPSFPFLIPIAQQLEGFYEANQKIRVFLGSQTVSKYENGAHTGEVGSFQITDFVDYAIIGHSERRLEGETPEDVNQKIQRCLIDDLTPIVCISKKEEYDAISVELKNKILIAYEPIDAISTSGVGKPADPESVEKMAGVLGIPAVIYGGSINSSNIENYLLKNYIVGFLVGNASLDPIEFTKLISIINKVYE